MGLVLVLHYPNTLSIFHIPAQPGYLSGYSSALDSEASYRHSFYHHRPDTIFPSGTHAGVSVELFMEALSASDVVLGQKESAQQQNTMVIATA